MATRSLVALAAVLGPVFLVACTLGGETIVNEHAHFSAGDAGAATAQTASSSTAASSTGAQCAGAKLAAPDLGTLEACGTHGHCWPQKKLPKNLVGLFKACPSAADACVPDEILQANGKTLPECKQPDTSKAVVGEGGGCITLAMMPQVEAQAGQYLKQQTCGEGQVCMPCKDPRDGSATPFCAAIGVLDGTCEDTATATPAPTPDAGAPAQGCCTANGVSNGMCLSSSVLPADHQDAMPQDTCAKTDVCMPASLIRGKPTTCDAAFPFDKGVCLDRCFSTFLKVGGAFHTLSQEGCGETELCTPCFILAKTMPEGITVPGCQ